jgi:hypothetical protein
MTKRPLFFACDFDRKPEINVIVTDSSIFLAGASYDSVARFLAACNSRLRVHWLTHRPQFDREFRFDPLSLSNSESIDILYGDLLCLPFMSVPDAL